MPETLRDGLLKHLYALLKKHVGEDGDAMSMLVAQYVESQAQGTELVDGVKRANEEFMEGVRRSQGQDGMCCAYVRFVEEWCKKEIDANIVSDVNLRRMIIYVFYFSSERNSIYCPRLGRLRTSLRKRRNWLQDGFG